MPSPVAEGPPPELRSGERIGHYRIVALLGRGGMGLVYQAVDSKLGREVALKRPWPDPAPDSEAKRRFLREARAASRLAHPNIVPVFEVFEHEGVPWLAMELVGGSLRAQLDEHGGLGVDDVLRYSEQLAEALQVAHEKGVLHRDVKPGNILLTPDGRARLTDFGLASFYLPAGSSASTYSGSMESRGQLVGTWAYMSPEQILGRPLDPRSDVFSLGAVMYEMSTGRPAFADSKEGDVIDAILNREPEAISRFSYSVPAELERIIRKALAKLPDERYQDARDLAADLRALRRRSESGPRVEREVRWRRRPWPRGLTLSAAALMAFVVLAGLAATLLRRGWGTSSLPGRPRQLTSGPRWEAQPRISPDGASIAYASDAAGAPDIWIVDAHGGNPVRLTDDSASDRCPAWFPDGSALAFVSDRGGSEGIRKVPRLGGPAPLLVPSATDPAISPDGRRIAFARASLSGDDRIFVTSLEDPARPVQLTDDRGGMWAHRHPAWSPDGRTICYADARDLWLVPSGGGLARRLTAQSAGDFEPAWSSDGRFVFFTSYREGTQALWRVPARGGGAERLTVGTGPEGQVSASRDGTRLAYSTFAQNFDVVVTDLASGERYRLADQRDEQETAFSPDAATLAFLSDRWAGGFEVWLQPLIGARPAGPPGRLTDQPGTISTPSFSPDGRWIAYRRRLERVLDLWIVPASGGVPERFSDGGGPDLHPTWSPDGSRLAFVSERDGRSRIWVVPVREGRRAGPARPVTSGATTDLFPVFSPDGSRIAYVGRSASGSEVWSVPADGGAAARPLTRGAMAFRVRWPASAGGLWFSGTLGGKALRLWKLAGGGGVPVALEPPIVFEGDAPSGDFDVSPDARLLAYTVEESRGDIWVLESGRGVY